MFRDGGVANANGRFAGEKVVHRPYIYTVARTRGVSVCHATFKLDLLCV